MRTALLLALLALGGCALFARKPTQPAMPVRYVLGAPYQALGVWRYPREQFAGEETGLATVMSAHGPRATDDEVFDQTALAASHPTSQLPALARVTNLETGREITVRVNDRGPLPATRAIGLTTRAAELIGARDGTRTRIRFLDAESRQLAAELQGDAGKLAVATAPIAAVRSETLAPPPGVGQGRARVAIPSAERPVAAAPAPASTIPLRLPERVDQVVPSPGSLFVVAGIFGRLEYAEIQRRRLAGLGASVATSFQSPRDRAYRVEIGPLASVANADTMLGQVFAAGVPDARIVVQ